MAAGPSRFAWLALTALLLAAPAGAQSPQGDSAKPIEINADSLEVLEAEQVAIFRGNVDALQGDIRLKADELKVHYNRRQLGGGGISGAISRIDASGGVFISSPTETAQGDRGVYLVDRREITLTGKVVLTRGESVIRGQSLVMSMVTGRSRVEGDTAAGGGGRVHGIFMPEGAGRGEAASGEAAPAPSGSPLPRHKPPRGAGN